MNQNNMTKADNFNHKHGTTRIVKGSISRKDIKLIPAKESDIPNMIKWEMETIKDGYPNRTIPSEEYDKVEKFIKKDARDSVWKTRMIKYNDQTIGMLTAYQVDDDWYIGEIYIIEEFRGHGIGTFVLKNEIDNHDQISLNVYKSNHEAIKLYESLGFKVYEETEERYMMRLTKDKSIQESEIPSENFNKVLSECINEYDVYEESTLSSTERDDLNDSEFGIPNKRKYPLTDKTHVLKAVQFFKFADASDRPELAKRIINKAKEFNMDYSNWNSIKEYLPKEFMKEGFDMNYDRFGNPLNQTFVQDNSQIMMEAVSPEQAEKNRKENLKLLQYDPKKRTIVVDGPDGQPMTVKAVITNFDVNSSEPSTGFLMKKQIFVGIDKHGDTYIRIPPAFLTKDPSMLIPILDHEVEHINQMNHQKQKTGDVIGHFTPRDDECVLEYARKFIKKHGKFLNPHDKLEYELLADFHAASKHGRKSYMKALRDVAEYGLSLKRLKNATVDIFEDSNPQLKLFRKGDYSVKSHIKAVEGHIKKCEYIKKNCEKVFELSNKQAENFTTISPITGMSYETNMHETYEMLSDSIEITLESYKEALKTLKAYESDTISEEDIKQLKIMNIPVKIQTSKPILIANLVKSIISTELRGKFIKQIMKDKPWLNNTDNINESYIPEEFNDFDIESEFINEYGYDAFGELSMFLESDEGETFDDDFDISSFGSDTFSNKSPNNEYDETEVKILNALIADEQHAVGRYFDAAKNSKDKNLSRLYADIGAEERFHAEQLMYSKSMLTGEEYTPFDPEVKKEYEELLAMGMDEESAMTTAIDKRSMLPNYDDGDDSDVDEIQKDVEMLEYVVNEHANMLNVIDMICESDNFTMEQRDHALNVLLENYIIQEAVDNVKPSGSTQKIITNPIYQLLNGFSLLLKLIGQIGDKIKNFINRNKVKQMRIREFIKTNGILGIFKPGVSLYFYDPKTPGDISIAPFQYIELMNNVAVDILNEHGLTTGLDKIDLGLSSMSIRYSNAKQGLSILSGVVLTKTKIIVDDKNKKAIEELFFGFDQNNRVNINSPDKYDKIMRSGNIYNKLNNLLNWSDLSCKKISKSIQAVQNLQNDTNSIYYTDRNRFNSCVEKLKQVERSFNRFLNCMVSDINTVMKLNNGILEATNAKDEEFNKNNPNM